VSIRLLTVIYTVEPGKRISFMDVVFMFGQMVRSILETMSMGSGRAKGKQFASLYFYSIGRSIRFLTRISSFSIETWPHGAKYEGDYHEDRRNGTCLPVVLLFTCLRTYVRTYVHVSYVVFYCLLFGRVWSLSVPRWAPL
jgi:hypothetical protein